jgi:hypothetical protein
MSKILFIHYDLGVVQCMTICNGSLDLISRNFDILNLYFQKISNKLSKYPKIRDFVKYEFNYCLTCVPTMVSSMTIYFARLTFHLVELYRCCGMGTMYQG